MIKVRYDTTEKINKTKNTFQYKSLDIEIEPIRIIRIPCGSGSAAKRYYYEVEFLAPKDARFQINGVCRENIVRRINRSFNPKEFEFVNNVSVVANG